MTTPPAPSVINPDILPPPHPDTSAPSGDRPLNILQVVTSLQNTTVDFSNPAHAPSPDASKASVQSTSSQYHAAVYLLDRAFSKLSSYGFHARCEGSGDDKRILVSFFALADLTSSTAGLCADLLDLVFVQYSPADAKRNIEAKSLFITDIPLFLTETQVHSAFSHYSSVVRCKFSLQNHYYTAIVQFSTADLIAQFDDTWAILCLNNSLCVYLAAYLKTQCDAQRHHVAVLASISKNIKEADLADIATQVSAKAINIPLSYTSYKPKPYVYMNFFSIISLALFFMLGT
ncbi:hypothetical protein RhiirC2_794403 [Rhizophagus irregularis]|uniref:RRM domain-containing protein n=1 Tax=Rhizophagus irregularis TaxID=588596 RepID=A0A2N1MDL7_9GLOM|nr:hypothetical protein RhiirC2_794403 [Rhizophagus irregularis]